MLIMLMLICFGRSRGGTDVNVNPRDLYWMSLDRDGASDMKSNPQGQHEDDKEEQRQRFRFKGFEEFHQNGRASGFWFGLEAPGAPF